MVRADLGDADGPRERFAVVVTVGDSPVRRTADGTGVLEATSEASAAWLAGQGLLAVTWPAQMDHTLRDDWLEQQTETAWALADDLQGPAWSTLMLPVDGVSTPFHYRESEFGWVLVAPPRAASTSARTGAGSARTASASPSSRTWRPTPTRGDAGPVLPGYGTGRLPGGKAPRWSERCAVRTCCAG